MNADGVPSDGQRLDQSCFRSVSLPPNLFSASPRGDGGTYLPALTTYCLGSVEHFLPRQSGNQPGRRLHLEKTHLSAVCWHTYLIDALNP
jgi:hypothetical protein